MTTPSQERLAKEAMKTSQKSLRLRTPFAHIASGQRTSSGQYSFISRSTGISASRQLTTTKADQALRNRESRRSPCTYLSYRALLDLQGKERSLQPQENEIKSHKNQNEQT